MIEVIFALLLVFQIKHWLFDYPLQTPFMLKKGLRKGWVLPLIDHAGCHSCATMAIASGFYWNHPDMFNTVILLGVFDFVMHFITDRVKAHPDLGGRYDSDNPKFWYCLGADQMIHHLTHYVIIYYLVTSVGAV